MYSLWSPTKHAWGKPGSRSKNTCWKNIQIGHQLVLSHKLLANPQKPRGKSTWNRTLWIRKNRLKTWVSHENRWVFNNHTFENIYCWIPSNPHNKVNRQSPPLLLKLPWCTKRQVWDAGKTQSFLPSWRHLPLYSHQPYLAIHTYICIYIYIIHTYEAIKKNDLASNNENSKRIQTKTGLKRPTRSPNFWLKMFFWWKPFPRDVPWCACLWHRI